MNQQQKGTKIGKERWIFIVAIVLSTGGVFLDIFARSAYSILMMGVGFGLAFVGGFILLIRNRMKDPRYQSEFRTATLYDPPEKTISVEHVEYLYQKATPQKKDICMISKIPLEDEKDVLQCPYCESYFLGEYLREWVEEKAICPVCKNNLKIKS